jgi:hypothetical protein
LFIVASFTTAKIWNELGSSGDDWIKKKCCRHTMDAFLPLRKKEILTFAKTWTNLKDTMLSAKSQAQKTKYRVLLLTCGI